jgi:hypothetical protein
MSKRKDPLAERDELRRQMERLAVEALRRAGDLVPVTPEEVAAIEEREGVMPPRRLTPPDLTKPFVRKTRLACAPVDEEVAENLARAARDGKTISAEIEERMRKDRAAARPPERGNGNGKAD